MWDNQYAVFASFHGSLILQAGNVTAPYSLDRYLPDRGGLGEDRQVGLFLKPSG